MTWTKYINVIYPFARWLHVEFCRAVAGEKSSSFKAIGPVILEKTEHMVGWLFWFKRPFETVFQSISGRLPERGRKKRERTEQGKNVRTTPTRTYCKRKRPLLYYHPNCRTPGTGSLLRTIALPDHRQNILTFLRLHMKFT